MKKSWRNNVEFYLIGLLLLMVIAFSIAMPNIFWSVSNFQSIASQMPVLGILALAAFGVAWYLTDGDLAALPQRLKTLHLPEWVTLWQAHEPKPGARLI